MKNDTLTLYKIGQEVNLTKANIDGVIVGIKLIPGAVQYEIDYSANGQYLTGQFYEFQFTPYHGDVYRIGFL